MKIKEKIYKSAVNLMGQYWQPYGFIEENNLVEEFKSEGIPSFFIKKGRKYGRIEYDFLHTDFVLRDEPLKVIKSLFKCMDELSELDYSFKRLNMADKTYGESMKYELNICELVAPSISTIIYNPQNWDDSPRDRSI